MGVRLPQISRVRFEERLRAVGGKELVDHQVELLHRHYEELCRWNPRVSLVGPIGVDEVVERHYGESLAAGPLLDRPRGTLVDVGSGAGFPGLVLAVLRPEIEVFLTESRGRKWTFLTHACRLAGLSTVCLNVRVGLDSATELPKKIDWITSRAVHFDSLGLEVLLPRLAEGGAILYWAGANDPQLGNHLKISRQIPLPGATTRRILEIVRD